METHVLNNIRNKLRRRLAEYRFFKLNKDTSIHVNAVDICLCLTDYALDNNRQISKNEENWFKAGWELIQVFENSDWEDIIELYHSLCKEVEKHNYFRK